MIIRQFLLWARTAAAGPRARAASALARAYLYSNLSESEKEEAMLALAGLLDDPSPLVRRAMAESFADAEGAPHHIVLGLADDQSDISSIVLRHSPVLTDSDLIDCAAIGDALAQTAIALRSFVSAAVSAAIAEVGAREALIALASNLGTHLPEFSMRRMIERFGKDGRIREALLSRPNLPASLRADLVAATAYSLSSFVTARAWMSWERASFMTREACEQAHVIIAATSGEGTAKLVAHLRQCGQLTASLLLRALLSGNCGLVEAALVELSALPLARVKGLLQDWRSAGFAMLYRRAGLPETLLPAFRAAIEALSLETEQEGGASLSRRRVERVLTACEAANEGELDRLLAVLRRFHAEAARDEARDFSAAQTELAVRSGLAAVNSVALEPAAMPEEPPLLLVDCYADEPAAMGNWKLRRIEPQLDLDAIERELAAA
ncbi:MAG TPA: DUF2336 domain-containing protein [Methylovirgula sp.]|nr:DUF2336 domain-containing protein [Methylovirgula sp.]